MIDIDEATGLMDEDLQNIEAFPHNFEAATPAQDCLQTGSSVSLQQSGDYSQRTRGHSWARRRLMHAASMLNLFSLPGLPWGSSGEKIELTTAEVESLRSEIADAEERESHLRAQLEHVDEILRSARLAGYLFIRNRWTALPGEPPIDDSDVDDWLPRFVVLNGPCIFFYLQSTDLSPQDSTLLSDVVEVETMPSFLQEDQQMRHSFYILTHQGLRFECSSLSKVQVDSWLAALRMDCNLGSSAVTEDPIKS